MNNPLRYNKNVMICGKGRGIVAHVESICARLCLLTRVAWKDGLPAPFSRATVSKLIRLGALTGLTLRRVEGVSDAQYARAQALLSRSSEVFAQVETMGMWGYEIVLPEDEDWPINLYAMKQYMPQFLFVRGNRLLLQRRAVSVAGSRDICEQTISLARNLGNLLAQKGYTLVCGGAWGVDTAVQSAHIQSGGGLILVPGYPIERLLKQEYLSSALKKNQLLIVCDTWPQECFSSQKALMRNHAIYALGDAAIVVASQVEKGGSWNGACECLKHGYTRLFAMQGESTDFEGNKELIKYGAIALHMNLPLDVQLFEDGM